jgi:hypothetical protein
LDAPERREGELTKENQLIMRRKTIIATGSIAVFLLCPMLVASDVWAADSASEPVSAGGSSGSGHVPLNRRTYLRPQPERDTLTNHYFGLGPKLSEAGIESTLNLWMLYQWIVDGGLESDDGSSGFYFFANHFDLEKMIGLKGASLFARVDGSCMSGSRK